MTLRRCLVVLFIGVLVLTSSAGALAAGGGPHGPDLPLPGGGPAGPAAPSSLAGTAFTYQGELNKGGPVNATCDMAFNLWDAAGSGTPPTGGNLIAGQLIPGVVVAVGRFTVVIDFGSGAFDGNARWLAIAVRCPPDAGLTNLSPRQPLTPAPLALALPGLRTEQNDTSPNVIGGFSGNSVTAGVHGATISGGGVSGFPNAVFANYGTVGGGEANGANGAGAVVGGGIANFAVAEATVGGGFGNTAGGVGAFVGGGGYDGSLEPGNTASGAASTIGGGISNTASGEYVAVGGGISNTASGVNAVVAGGASNTASSPGGAIGGGAGNTASGINATVSGGLDNTASGLNAVVAGGAGNTASGWGGTVGGGASNTASGTSATVPGGQNNTASGGGSFAAGFQASALHDGAFVWNDDSGAVLNSKHPNQFLVRASGGITMITNSDVSASGAVLAAGSNSWSMLSDRNAKANFSGVDGVQVLDALAGIPIQTWNYKTQAAAIRHIGPMAQDFYSAFQVGENDTTISTVDGQGVALAAIQGLYTLVQQKDSQISTLRDTSVNQQAQITALSARVSALEGGAAAPGQAAQPAPLPLALPWLLLAGLVLLNVGGLAGYLLARKHAHT